MKLKIKVLLSLMIAVIVMPVSAQQINALNLNDLYDLAEKGNRNLKILLDQQEIASINVKEQKQRLLPTLEASLSLSYNGDGWVSDRDFSNGMNIPIPDFGNNFALEAKQIIYAGGAIKNSIEIAKLSAEMAKVETEKNRQNIRFAITGYFLEIHKLMNQKVVLDKNIEQADKMIKEIRDKSEHGIALKNNITRYELQLQALQVSLLKLNNTLNILNKELVQIVQLPIGTKIALATLEHESHSFQNKESWNNYDWNSDLRTHSPVLKQATIGVDIASKNESIAKSERLPQVFAFAADYLNGPVTIEIPALDNNFNYWYAGVGVKYNISSLFKNKTKESKAKLGTRIAEESYLDLQEKLNKDLETAKIKYLETIDVYKTQLKNVELAKQNYDVIQNRYLNQLSLITEMLDAENIKLDAELQATNAKINILFHYYQLRKIVGTL